MGFLTAAFLLLNGWRLTASEAEAYEAVIAVVEGRSGESKIADWLRGNTEPVHQNRRI